ncbi:hypothetical protein C9374_007030 [Naegleria lovaniensis]|uniref:Uncharacterized protein n=1 Tax=Naegleria lovaniensis TaxID=51637 RepID=A0AA88H4M5_NAELO|nr:uncharacterized protein C9374_007030 [Naegleria lovaniensis]KAG2393499.1 hypothetical protein C9374_007030 [Naegleria lovaniensis]
MELLIFGGIALFSAGVGAGYYTCYYKPLSEAEERNIKQAPSATLIEQSSSVESIVNNGKITDRDYFHKLGGARGNRNSSELLMDGIIINNNHDDENEGGVSNTMEGYEELPEHAISLVLQKSGKQVTTHTSAVRFDCTKPSSLLNNQNNKGSTSVSINQVASENLDGDIDLDKFLRKEQEMKDQAFEESIKEKHPYGF